jgi:hypothetical protein
MPASNSTSSRRSALRSFVSMRSATRASSCASLIRAQKSSLLSRLWWEGKVPTRVVRLCDAPTLLRYTNYTSTMTTSALTDTIWYDWSGGTSTAASTITMSTTDTAWRYWVSFHSDEGNRPPQRSAAEIEADRVRRLAAIAAREVAEREAQLRANALLHSLLTDDERALYREQGHVIVRGRHARYRLTGGRIDVIGPDGRLAHRLCVHPDRTLPPPDVIVAQKLWLDHDEDALVRLANRHEALEQSRRALILPPLREAA